MKITVVCDNDPGTSLMMEMSIKSILKDLSVSADIDHADLGPAKGMPSDICVGIKDVAKQSAMQPVAGKIVALENMIDKKAMREHLFVVLAGLSVL